MIRRSMIAGAVATVAVFAAAPAAEPAAETSDDATYTEHEITQATANFFGTTTEVAAKAVQRVFNDLGQPDAYIKGDEGSGAFVVGAALWLGLADPQEPRSEEGLLEGTVGRLRHRRQRLEMLHPGLQSEARAAAVPALPRRRRQHLFVAGIGVIYMRSGGVTLAPMRTGVGLRAGVNAQYQVYSDKARLVPAVETSEWRSAATSSE